MKRVVCLYIPEPLSMGYKHTTSLINFLLSEKDFLSFLPFNDNMRLNILLHDKREDIASKQATLTLPCYLELSRRI